MPNPRTADFQFRQSGDALREAENLYTAGYWAACVSNAYQTVLRAAAGLLYGQGVRPQTEREVRIGFAAAFVSSGLAAATHDRAFRTLEKLRHQADYEHEHTTTNEEATLALRLARDFHAEAQRLRKEGLK